jgi:hypothetical protein
MAIQQGQFVEVRGRPWLVEAVDDTQPDLTTLRLSCIADDAQGEQIEVLWDAEIGTRVIEDDTWSQVGRGAPDSPEVLAAYLRAIRWKSATAADRDLLQAPLAIQNAPQQPCAMFCSRISMSASNRCGRTRSPAATLGCCAARIRRACGSACVSAFAIASWHSKICCMMSGIGRLPRSGPTTRPAGWPKRLRSS